MSLIIPVTMLLSISSTLAAVVETFLGGRGGQASHDGAVSLVCLGSVPIFTTRSGNAAVDNTMCHGILDETDPSHDFCYETTESYRD